MLLVLLYSLHFPTFSLVKSTKLLRNNRFYAGISARCHKTSDHHTQSGHSKIKIKKKAKRKETTLQKKRAEEELIPVRIQQHDEHGVLPTFDTHKQVKSGQNNTSISYSDAPFCGSIISMGKSIYTRL